MKNPLSYKIHPKEKVYFSIKLAVSLMIYMILLISVFLLNDAYILMSALNFLIIIGLLFLFRMGILVGYLRGYAIKVTKTQFQEIYQIASNQSKLLGFEKTPEIYLLQAGGLLNAFATRFFGRSYIVLYSDVLEEAYKNNIHSVEFIIGHELGHIKRNHFAKQLFLLPSIIIPFLNSAYSRACEYTCDNIGAALSPKGARTGLLLLVAGKKLYNKVHFESLIEQQHSENGFWSWITEKISSHPKLIKRITAFKENDFFMNDTTIKIDILETSINDHYKYMPRI